MSTMGDYTTGTMTNTGIPTAQSSAWASYQRMRVLLSGRINRELSRKTGLSEADFEILFALTEVPDESVRALALRCGLAWEKSRLSHQLRRMEERGLLTREDCLEDNRGSVIRVTEAGRRLASEARGHYEAAVRRYVIDVLTPEQLEALGAISETLLAQLEEPHTA